MSNACLKGTARRLRLTTVRSSTSKRRITALKTTQNQMCMNDLAADREHNEISHAAIISVESGVSESYICRSADILRVGPEYLIRRGEYDAFQSVHSKSSNPSHAGGLSDRALGDRFHLRFAWRPRFKCGALGRGILFGDWRLRRSGAVRCGGSD